MSYTFGSSAPVTFRDRWDAGEALALLLREYATGGDAVVLGLARGGIPVARPVADAIGAPMDVFVACKVRVPGIEEVALCAIAEGTERLVADKVAWYIGVPSRVVRRLSKVTRVEIERRVIMYRNGRSLTPVRGRTVILVDDGIATGATMCAAVEAIRARGPKAIIVAVAVATSEGGNEVRPLVEALVVAREVPSGHNVSSMYANFAHVSDVEVRALLTQTTVLSPTAIVLDISERISRARIWDVGEQAPVERQLAIPVENGMLRADYAPPYPASNRGTRTAVEECAGLVVLVHGGGSNRNSFRNRYIAGRLRVGGYATVRLDLALSGQHDHGVDAAPASVDVWRSAARLTAAFEWLHAHGFVGTHAPILMGASTSAAAALCAAALLRKRVSGVIARSGNVDLALPVLQYVHAPVLMIAGAADRRTVTRNKSVLRQFRSGAQLLRVKGAGHAFDEPGALGAVAEHVIDWLRTITPPLAAG
jgi:putative phosphoribosyl transferase